MSEKADATVDPEVGLGVLQRAKAAIYAAFAGQGDSPASAVSTAIVGYSNAINAAAVLTADRDRLAARVAALQAEVDACGDIIGQPHGATHGHAEILEETIKEHQADNVRLAARVAELESWKSVLLSEYTMRDLQYEAVRDDLRKASARVAELEREVERVRRQNEIAHRALAEAASRFAAKDMEGVRLLLCDRNAQSNAAALAPRAEVKP